MVKLFLKAEAMTALAGGLVIWFANDGSLVWLLVLVLLPDLSMVGYLAGNRVGAFTYNLAHSLASAVTLLGAGWLTSSRPLLLVGALLLAHAGMDRLLGYGLKLTSGFHDTHLGRIGPRESRSSGEDLSQRG